MTSELLKHVVVLSPLPPDVLQQLWCEMAALTFADGDVLVQQGAEAHGLVVITEGTVAVWRKGRNATAEAEVGQLRGGDFFDEPSLLMGVRSGVTVRAVGPVSVRTLGKAAYARVVGTNGDVSAGAASAVAAPEDPKHPFPRLGYTHQFHKRRGGVDLGRPANVIAPDAEAEAVVLNAVKHHLLFMPLSHAQHRRLVAVMHKLEVAAGAVLYSEGELGATFFVVQKGLCALDIGGVTVASRPAGTCFGELAIMYNCLRETSAKAVEDSVVWLLDRYALRRVVKDISEEQIAARVEVLAQVPLLEPLSAAERLEVAEAVDELQLESGAVVIRQGDAADAMYMVAEGKCVALKKEEGYLLPEEVAWYGPGDYFGERGLLKGRQRGASVEARTPVRLLRLDRHAMALLLSNAEDLLSSKLASYELKILELRKEAARAAKERVPLEELEVIGTLGKGSFGHVQLVRDRTGKTYALKAVNKAQIILTGQTSHILSEKRVMEQLDHPFLVKLWGTYKDRDRLYFLLEPSLGGELFSVLRVQVSFDEPTARFYTGCVVLAFEYMHSKQYIYRDLKPENLLLDHQGYIKVTDFGFAKDISNGCTYTLCGTPDYLAPEIVSGRGHGKGVDWWTLGIFLFEMLASFPPFYDEDPMRTYAKIMYGQIDFPEGLSSEATHFLRKLLTQRASKRLGVGKDGPALLKRHAWFEGFSWADLLAKRLAPYHVPAIKGNEDLSNFEEYPEEDDPIQPYVDDGTGWDEDF